MKKPSAIFTAALLLIAPALGADEPVQNDAPHFSQWIDLLSSESYTEREKATHHLWKAGQAAIAPLQKARQSDDPEVALRATHILNRIELRITPDTPPEIYQQIEAFRSAPKQERSKHLDALREKGAYFQLLKMFSLEKNTELRKLLESYTPGIALSGALDAVVNDDYDEAILLLNMSSKEHDELFALAWIYKHLAETKGFTSTPPLPDGVTEAQWRIVINRVHGKLDEALKIAVDNQLSREVASLLILKNDPTPWMAQMGAGESVPDVLKNYIHIAQQHWHGKPILEQDIKPLSESILDEGASDQAYAAIALAALGKKNWVDPYQIKNAPQLAYERFLIQEKIEEALQIIGIDFHQRDTQAWTKKRMEQLSREEDETDDEVLVFELVALAAFLENAGLGDELKNAYDAPLKQLAEESEIAYVSFLQTLLSVKNGACRYATENAIQWAGDDQKRWGLLNSRLFGEDKQQQEWQAWLNSIDPQLDRVESFRILLAFFGMSDEKNQYASVWIDKAWLAVEKLPQEKRAPILQKALSLAFMQLDVAATLKIWDAMEGNIGSPHLWQSIEKFMTAAGRWNDAVALLEKHQKKGEKSAEFHAKLAVAYRRAGMEERAKEYDILTEKLCLGYAPSCQRIAYIYQIGGEMEKAQLWFQRAAWNADDSAHFYHEILESYARAMFDAENWAPAASAYETLACIYVRKRAHDEDYALYLKSRLNADLTKALAILPNDRQRALSLFDNIRLNFKADGILADDFFPKIIQAGFKQEAEIWFEESWALLSANIKRFPDSHNTRNTAAWLASRSGFRLQEAKKHLEFALEKHPNQAAYLDTLAEVHFALGDRKEAIRLSTQSLQLYPMTEAPYDTMIRKQNHRFHRSPLPFQ